MIESLSLKNYKAFEDVTIPIKPLTILLGANSVGKSSIIQMLMLLHQTAEERYSIYTSAFKIYGRYVNVGSYENLIKDKDKSHTLIVKVDFSDEEIQYRLKKSIHDFTFKFKRGAGAFSKSEYPYLFEANLDNREEFKMYVSQFVSAIKKTASEDQHILQFLQYRLDLHVNLLDDNLETEIMRAYELRDSLSRYSTSDISIIYQLQAENDLLRVRRFTCMLNDGYVIMDIEKKTDKNIKITSDFNLSGKDTEYLSSIVNLNNTIFDIFDFKGDETDVTPTLVSTFFYNLLSDILTNFRYELNGDKINYVSPLRAHPKRYYMLDKARMSISLDTLDGDAIAEVLKENKEVKKQVNQWFSKFGFKIDVNMLREVIHHMNVKQGGLDLDITDVGFGISQVLPIIIQGFLSDEESLTIIEQPEIHLHPKMQADLGDLFIDIVTSEKKKMVIETHSEYLLRRIRRRISEGKIDNNDVSICLFHPRTKSHPAWVEVLEVGEKGDFKWPEEFYCGDLYDDITEFIKNQVNGHLHSSALNDQGSKG